MVTSAIVVVLATFAGLSIAAPNSRIVGGQLSSIERHPSMVAVESFRNVASTWNQNCGGTILNEGYILSAANCFTGIDYQSRHRRIRVGSTLRNSGGVVINIVTAHNHPSYLLTPTHDGDITVVRLAERIQYSPVIQPAKIPPAGYKIPDNSSVIHAGWGVTIWGGAPFSHLREVTVYTINHRLCTERYDSANPPRIVTENMICAGILDEGGKDACQGDGGGPMYYGDVVVGVISWGTGCGHPYYPGVSTAVSSYTDWIVSIAV